jgi:hypothetical protein
MPFPRIRLPESSQTHFCSIKSSFCCNIYSVAPSIRMPFLWHLYNQWKREKWLFKYYTIGDLLSALGWTLDIKHKRWNTLTSFCFYFDWRRGNFYDIYHVQYFLIYQVQICCTLCIVLIKVHRGQLWKDKHIKIMN